MGKPETSIELAKTHFSKKKWREMKPSKRAALAILQDCLDRRGIKWEFEKCDPDIIESIVEKITLSGDTIDITFSYLPSSEELTKRQRNVSGSSPPAA